MSLASEFLDKYFNSPSRREVDLLIGQDQNGNPVYINTKLLEAGLHLPGLTRRGKTNSFENLIRQLIELNQGLFYLDPHGQSYERMVKWCTQRGFLTGEGPGRKKIILLDPTSDTEAFGFNPLQFGDINPRIFSNCVDYIVNASAQVWGGENTNATPRIKKYFGSLIQVLAEKHLTFLEIIYLLKSKDRRVLQYLIQDVQNETFRAVLEEMAYEMTPREFRDLVDSTFSRVIEFIKHPYITNIIAQQGNVIEFRKIMDEGWIVLANLSTGAGLTEDSSRFLGTLLINDIVQKARQRPVGSRPFYLFIDECHLYLNSDIETILNQMAKRGLRLVLAHQNLSQLDQAGAGVRKAIIGIQNRIVFRTEIEDGKELGQSLFTLDLEEPKKSLIKPVVVGQKIIKLKTENEGIDRNYQKTITENPSSENSAGIESNTVDGEGNLISSSSTTHEGTATPLGPATSEGEGISIKKSKGEHETLAPVYKDLPGGTYGLDEQNYKKARYLADLPKGHAVVQIDGGEGKHVITPLVPEPYASPERVLDFVKQVNEGQQFIKPIEVIEAEKNERQRLLLENTEKFHNTFDDPEEVIDFE